jgi:cation diffusion facilitator family transporter
MSGTSGSVRAILYALGANIGIFVAKAVAAVITGSGAMLAEAVHSLADCGNQGLLLFGMKRAKRPPTPDYPLGYGKEVYFWSFLVALMLFSVGGAFSVYEGIHKILQPEPIERPVIGVAVLAFSLALEWWSLRACLQEVNKTRGAHSLWRWFRDSRDSEMIVVFGEQLAAILGLAAALLAVAVTLATGDPIYDAIGTLGIGVLLIVVAVFVAIEVKALLIGQSVAVEKRQAIRAFLEGAAGGAQDLQRDHAADGPGRDGGDAGLPGRGHFVFGAGAADQYRWRRRCARNSRTCAGASSSPTTPTERYLGSARQWMRTFTNSPPFTGAKPRSMPTRPWLRSSERNGVRCRSARSRPAPRCRPGRRRR